MATRLTARRAQAFQSECIAQLQKGKVQAALLSKCRDLAGAGSEGGAEVPGLLRAVAVPALLGILSQYGFEDSEEGACLGLRELLKHAAADALVLQRHCKLAGLLCPHLSCHTCTLDAAWAQATLARLTCAGTDVLAEYVASLTEFSQASTKDEVGVHEADSEEAWERARLQVARQVPSLGAPTFERAAVDEILGKVAYTRLSLAELHVLDAFLQSLLPPPNEEEGEPVRSIELTLRDMVDMQLDHCGASLRPSLPEALALDSEAVRRAVQGIPLASVLQQTEELIAALSGAEYQAHKRRARDMAGCDLEAQLMYHGLLTPPIVTPIMAKYGHEISIRGWELMNLISFAHRRSKKVLDNTTRIGLLFQLDQRLTLRGTRAAGYKSLEKRHEEIREAVECLKAFRRALDAEPRKRSSYWLCVGRALGIPEPGSCPATILPGHVMRMSEELVAPGGAQFLRSEEGPGWLAAVGCMGNGSKTQFVQLRPRLGRTWRVVGGAATRGIIVRRGRELSSPVLGSSAGPARLETGAEVREVELVGERLHYSRLRGEGPDFGWLSIACRGSPLLTVCDWKEDARLHLHESD